MATGKSTVGPKLAARLGLPFVDTDVELERETGRTVPELWRAEGEPAFRAREGVLVERLFESREPRVVAFGGGTVTIRKTRRLAIDHALVVTLTASGATIATRAPDLATRPNLAVGGDPAARAQELISQRAEAYAECHLSLSTDTREPDALVEDIVALVRRDPLLVPLGTRSYTIDVCDGEPGRLTDAVARCAPSSVLFVTDSNVQRARGEAFQAALRSLALSIIRVTLPPGEAHKELRTVETIWDAALGAGVDRDAVVVAAGGGVVGDLAGFAAACLLRGVRFVQAPTTLLAMVDASVGGKTGFDHPVGKNLIGAFHQPNGVVIDLAHLQTLPRRERAAGLAEVVKIALTSDAALFEQLERDSTRIAEGSHQALEAVVRAAVEAKIRIVRDDERETGLRALLNLGHTVGHALEAHGGYTRWLHGEAVALGLMSELAATARLGWSPAPLVERTRAVLSALGLPTAVSGEDVRSSWIHVGSDKKRSGGMLRLPVVSALGEARIERIRPSALREAVLPQ
jgi:shikimate kinase/3-dehydroquinate synthase